MWGTIKVTITRRERLGPSLKRSSMGIGQVFRILHNHYSCEWQEAQSRACLLSVCRDREEEEMYMQVMAELDAGDDSLDDGVIEIDESEVYGP